jgi:hypothetical protein
MTFLASYAKCKNVPGWPLCPRFHQRSTNTANAEPRLRKYAEQRGWTIALQVKEVGSGASEPAVWEKALHERRLDRPHVRTPYSESEAIVCLMPVRSNRKFPW